MRVKPWSILPPSKPTPTVWFVYLMWFVVLCDPQWWIASMTFGAFTRVSTLLFLVMLCVVAVHPPRAWFPPLMAFILFTLFVIPLAYARPYAVNVAKSLVAFYVLGIGSLALLRNVPLTVPIIAGQMMYSYIWWVVLGVAEGKVWWHPSLGNYDGYGPLMVIGIGSCYYFGLATPYKKERNLAFLVSLGCLTGMVSSFARGAVLAGGFVMLWIVLRSRHKLKAIGALLVGVVGLGIAGTVFGSSGRSEEGNNFFTEMATVVGNKDGTRDDREVLWALARREYMEHPIVGVGANNFGPYAAQAFKVGDTGGGYDENPGRLYDRQLHSTFFQILCEYGTVGSAIFIWMLADFFIRNAALRRKAFQEAWAERCNGRLDLHPLSLGLEVALIGFLTTGLFYNQIFDVHWLYTILIINTLLYYHARPSQSRSRQAARPKP